MKDAVVFAILSSLPPNPSPSPHHHHHHGNHSNTTTKPKPKPKPRPKHRPKPTKLTSHPPLLATATSRHRNRTDGVKYYAELASKLAEDGRFEDFLMIAESVVVASGARPSQFSALLDLKLVSIGIVRVIREGRVSSLFEALNGVRKLGFGVVELFDGAAMEELRRECRRIVRRGDVEQVVSFMETLHGFSFSVKEVVEPSDVIKLCVNKRHPSAAIRFAQIFPHVQMLFCTTMLEFGKKGDLVAALTVFESSKQNLGSPNMYAYRTIIDVCGLCGNYLKSRSIYEELLACKSLPNAHVFNSLMNVNACDLSYTLHIYKQMRKLGVPADIATYNILLKSCCLAGRVDLARGIYRKVRHLEMTGALKLDIFTYSTIIKVFADAKLWQMALKVKEDMLIAGVTPNTVTWVSLISACANAGLVERAIHLFEEMLHAGCRPNSQCCNILLHACVEACQYDRAFRLFHSWKESGFHRAESEAHGSQIDSSLSLNHMGENCTTTILDQISSSRHSHLPLKVPFTPTTSTYNTLMKACGTDFYRGKALMDEMKTVGLSPNHISWSILLDICGGSGNVDGALLILRSMRESGIQPDVITYTTAIKVCVESKNLRLAFSLFAEMKRNQIKPNMVTYNTLLRARSKYGSLQEVRQCLAIYQDMRKSGYNPNDYYLKRLIEEWCEEVIQISDQKKGPHYVDSSYLRAQSLLLEKVAEHLHKSDADSISIDLQGLSKVEARIVVLAVLRMIKEKYTQGNAIKDDLQIILGVHQNDSTNADENGAEAAVIRLLQNDMGLEVLTDGSSIKNGRHCHSESSDNSDLEFEVLEKSRLPRQLESSTRRPAVLKRLKVSKDSLYHWLQKRIGVSVG